MRQWEEHQTHKETSHLHCLLVALVRTTIAALLLCTISHVAFADGSIYRVQHVIVVMQENHSFDNYFGALAYAPGGAYHAVNADRDRDHDGDRDGDDRDDGG